MNTGNVPTVSNFEKLKNKTKTLICNLVIKIISLKGTHKLVMKLFLGLNIHYRVDQEVGYSFSKINKSLN